MFSIMSIQTQHSISHLLYVSSVPIVYRKGGVIFKIEILNIFQEKGRSCEASTRESAAPTPVDIQPPHFRLL